MDRQRLNNRMCNYRYGLLVLFLCRALVWPPQGRVPSSAQTPPPPLLQNLAPAIKPLVSFSSPIDDFLPHETQCCFTSSEKNLDFSSHPVPAVSRSSLQQLSSKELSVLPISTFFPPILYVLFFCGEIEHIYQKGRGQKQKQTAP